MAKQQDESYDNYIRNLIRANGRTRIWVSAQMGISRTTFWKNVNKDLFTQEEKAKLHKLIVEGKA